MNKARRKSITAILDAIQQHIIDLEAIRDEEQEAFDNLPENLQEAERGQSMQEAIDALDEAISSTTDAADHLANLSE